MYFCEDFWSEWKIDKFYSNIECKLEKMTLAKGRAGEVDGLILPVPGGPTLLGQECLNIVTIHIYFIIIVFPGVSKFMLRTPRNKTV